MDSMIAWKKVAYGGESERLPWCSKLYTDLPADLGQVEP